MSEQPARKHKTFDLPAGQMHHLDIGTGSPVVFVHGNPSSSAEFVPAIAELSSSHRCIAVDHLGFGHSDKPTDWDYLPAHHADNLAALLDALDLRDVTMVVGDWGGPIGLSWVLDHPERVTGLVITNTWLWSVRRSAYYRGFSWFMGGPIGRALTTRFNFFAAQVPKRAWGTRTPWSATIAAEFTGVHTRPNERRGMWVFPREIIGSSDWLASLWDRRANLRGIETVLLWGMMDIAFRADILKIWQEALPAARVEHLDDVGHFPALEATDRLVAAVRSVGESRRD
ncbi:MAG: alpha/beta fold hydrolase [Acidimicrobiales bacterium]